MLMTIFLKLIFTVKKAVIVYIVCVSQETPHPTIINDHHHIIIAFQIRWYYADGEKQNYLAIWACDKSSFQN